MATPTESPAEDQSLVEPEPNVSPGIDPGSPGTPPVVVSVLEPTPTGDTAAAEGTSDVAGAVGGAEAPSTVAVSTGLLTTNNASALLLYEFEIAQEFVGKFIGKQGTYITHVKEQSGAHVQVRDHPAGTHMKMVFVEGTRSQIDTALALIRLRFPENSYPTFSLTPLKQTVIGTRPRNYTAKNSRKNNHNNGGGPGVPMISIPLVTIIPTGAAPVVPPYAKLHLVEGVINDVILSDYRDAISLSLLLPTHPSYQELASLGQSLTAFYKDNLEAPPLTKPFNAGVICVAPTIESEWARVEVVSIPSDEICLIRHMDSGFTEPIDIDSLRQIRADFLLLPFQSIDCKLYGVQTKRPSMGVDSYFRPFMTQILQAHVIGYDTSGIPLINLYRLGDNQVPVLINHELVDLGLARFENGPEDSQSLIHSNNGGSESD